MKTQLYKIALCVGHKQVNMHTYIHAHMHGNANHSTLRSWKSFIRRHKHKRNERASATHLHVFVLCSAVPCFNFIVFGNCSFKYWESPTVLYRPFDCSLFSATTTAAKTTEITMGATGLQTNANWIQIKHLPINV